MSAYTITFVLLFIAPFKTEQIVNPGSHQTIICGIYEDCSVSCTGNYSCAFNTFYFYNHAITLQCDEEYSCSDNIIYSNNATSLQLIFNGERSFMRSSAFISSNNSRIITTCNGQHSCTISSFYYSGFTNQSVQHSCNDYWSCFSCVISAIPIHHITLNCLDLNGHHYSCYSVDLYIPSLPDSSTIINVETSWAMYNYVYAQRGTATLQIFCTVHCIQLDEFHLIHGLYLDNICSLSQPECISTNYNQFSDFTVKYVDIYNKYNAIDTDKLVLYIGGHTVFNRSSITTIISQSSSEIIVICVSIAQSSSKSLAVCDNMLLDLSNTNNGTVIANNGFAFNIIGPKQYFTRINYRAHSLSRNSNYYLNNTEIINFKCAQTWKSGNCIYDNNLYLGSNTALNIQCGPQSGCTAANIYSLIDPNGHSFSLNNIGWNINCIANSEFSCINFKIYFVSIWNVCNVPIGSDKIANCSLMPTLNPTTIPTEGPTDQPTENPTYNPTQPTQNPTFDISLGLLPRTVICPNGYQIYYQNNDFCVKCSENEYGSDETCKTCSDGTQSNENRTQCVLCPAKTIGLDGFCTVQCEFGTNELHTECAEDEVAFYGSDEFNAIMTVIGILSGCGCIFTGVWVYFKKLKKNTDEKSQSIIQKPEKTEIANTFHSGGVDRDQIQEQYPRVEMNQLEGVNN